MVADETDGWRNLFRSKVLTAGHCIKGSWLLSWLPLDVVAGAHDMFEYGPHAQVVNVDKRIAHPLFKGDIGPNDIAVLKTRTPLKFSKQIQPIRLPSKDLKYEAILNKVTLIGWGLLRTSFWPDIPRKLQEVELPLLPYEDCYRAVEQILDPGEANPLNEISNICTGPLTGGLAACSGDSGGPLVNYQPNTRIEEKDLMSKVGIMEGSTVETDCKQEDNTCILQGKKYTDTLYPVLIGVVSWGTSPCADEGAPTVYTKVSRYLDFIDSHINLK
ncbi:Trypsin-1 [Eumeta japonica]|uniref:Trypsin-1 n=1 Tax=Eumeta variegata TaxID=151549 RepID=A0A4C1WZ31_EUMVA|nr:Trypsin-1 [Eumeta japonica]